MTELDVAATAHHVVDLTDKREKRKTKALVALVGALILAIIALAVTVSYLTTKSDEQTRAEVQLRSTVASQQITIRGQQHTITNLSNSLHKAHANTLQVIKQADAKVAGALNQVNAFDNALGFVVIDAFHEGHLSKVLLRDLEFLARQVEIPLP